MLTVVHDRGQHLNSILLLGHRRQSDGYGAHGTLRTAPRLSAREVEVLRAWLLCDSKGDVARSLFLSLGTVNTHLTRIRAKYDSAGRPAPTKAALVARALQDGIIGIDDL